MVINHITVLCQLFNYYKDLEWGDHANNSRHAVETGLFNIKGERHPHSKLTEADVKKIRKHRVEGLTYSEIGRLFGISRRQAADVAKGVNWGWLKD